MFDIIILVIARFLVRSGQLGSSRTASRRYPEDALQAAPDIMAHRLSLFSQLEDPHAGEDLLFLADGEAVSVDPCTIRSL